MIPFAITLSSATRSDLLLLVYVAFWIFVPASFLVVARYALEQFRAGRLLKNENTPLPLGISGMSGWLFAACVLDLIFLQSALYVVLVIVGTVGQLLESNRTPWEQFGLDRLRPARLLNWSLLVVGAVLLIEILLTETTGALLDALHVPHPDQQTVESFRQYNRPAVILEFIFQAVLLFPIIEELFFRGFLLTFLKKYTSTWMALVLSAGVFAFAHPLAIGAVLPLWILGIVLGIAYEHTGSLLLPICIHSCWNLVTALSLLLEKGSS